MKTLCLGNSDIITDKLVSILAIKNKQINHGLISTADQVAGAGYYHTSLADVSTDDLRVLADCFEHSHVGYTLQQLVKSENAFGYFYSMLRI